MPSRKTSAALSAVGDEASKITDFIMYLEKIKREKEQEKKEEKRDERDYGLRLRKQEFTEAGVEREAEEEAGVARETSDYLASPAVNSVVQNRRNVLGVDAGNLASQSLGTAKTPQQASTMANKLELDTYKAGQLLSTQKKEEKKIAGRDEWLAELEKISPVAAKRMRALDFDMDVGTATKTFPFPEEEADDKPSDEWYMKQIVSVLTKTNPETKAPFTEKDAIRMLKLSPEQQMKFFGGEEFDTPSAASGALEGASLGTAAISPQPQTPLSAESQPAPMGEDYNPADHIPAGDTMPVAGETRPEEAALGTAVLSQKPEQAQALSPEEQTEQDLIKKALSGGGTLDPVEAKRILSKKGFAPDSIERILQGL